MMLISSPSEVYRKLLLFTIALLFGVLELWIPRIPLFPWLKPGFANVVTMIWLIRYGTRDALLFGILRIWISAFFFGFSFFTVVPALSGLLFSVLGGALLLKLNRIRPLFGFIGLGILGAFLHNTGQLLSLKLLIGEASLWQLQFPVMIAAALLTGSLTAVMSWVLDRIDLGSGGILKHELTIRHVSLWKKKVSAVLLAVMIAVLWLDTPWESALFMVLSAVAVSAVAGIRTVVQPIRRSWLFLLTLFLAARWGSGSWDDAFVHLFRLSGWILCTEIFRKLETDRLFFHGLHKLFPSYETTLAAALLTVELFPELMKNGAIKAALRPVVFIKSPTLYLYQLVEMSHVVIEESGWGRRNEKATPEDRL